MAELNSNFEDQLQYYDTPDKITDIKFETGSQDPNPVFLKQESKETEEKAVKISLCEDDKNEIIIFDTEDDKMPLISAYKPGPDNMYRCKECAFMTMERSYFSKHIHQDRKKINGYNKTGKRHKCHDCEFETMYITTFKRHLLRHKDPDEVVKYKCQQCEFQTKHSHALKQHLVHHMEPEQRDKYFHKCSECDYKSLDKSNLNNHVKRHKGIRTKYKCNECHFETVEKSRLKRHLLRHSNPENLEMFSCNDCDYTTFVKSYLTKHLLIHKSPSEVPMYKCELCDYETKYKSQVIRHHRRHERCHYNLGKKKVMRTKKMAVEMSCNNTFINIPVETKDHVAISIEEKVLDGVQKDSKTRNVMLDKDIKIENNINETSDNKTHNCLYLTSREETSGNTAS